jgi:PhoPQ-activated pathogenicity-related protein
MSAIMMTKEFWLNSQFSIARFYGGIHINETRYIIMGSEQDLVDDRFAKYYNKLGREKFMQILEQNNHADKGFVMQVMKDSLNAMKTIKRARKKQDNQLQTHLEL